MYWYILLYLCVRHVSMCACSVPKICRLFLQLSLAPDDFLVPECWLELAPNVMEVAHPWFRAALNLDKCPLSNLIRPRCAKRAKPYRGSQCSLCMQLAFSLVFTPYLSNAVVSANPHIILQEQSETNIQTDRQTPRHTDQVL